MKRLHLIIAIVAFIALLSSCSTKSKTNLVYYKVLTIDNTTMMTTNIEPKVLDSFQYLVGDSVFISKINQRIDNSFDSTNTIKAIVIKQLAIDPDTDNDL